MFRYLRVTTLARIWEELLGLPQVGRADHFFELGGHSLLTLQLVTRVRARMGVDLQVHAIYVSPTLSSFASAIDSAAANPGTSSLIEIRVGTRALAPVVFVHSGEGDVAYAFNLARWIDERTPVYGLTARRRSTSELAFDSIATMAAAYIGDIRAVCSQGPYRLLGWSAGGSVAAEMTRQLEEMGESVSFLGLIDTAVDYDRALGTSSEGSMPPVSNFAAQMDRALRAYRPLPISPRMCCLLLAADSIDDGDRDRWAQIVGERLIVQTVTGDHYSMVAIAHAQELGQVIDRHLAQSHSDSEERRA